ncbi:MAG: Rid family hydrolase [Rhodospirillaceae bacterium]|nr:Rid family hydrolase [Rhodospirillaceae bacterium]
MGKYRRINVGSGRPLEHLAHYSRALRVGDMVMQSGTTAIDTEGNVIGEGDVAAQVDAIVDIARQSMGKAGGRLEDVVRTRTYITDLSVVEVAGRALGKYFRDVRPASTVVGVKRLARPAQLIEIEFDAVDGAEQNAQRISSGRPTEEDFGYSRAVRVGDRVFIAGTTALQDDGTVACPGDVYGQSKITMETIQGALEEAGGSLGDLVYSKTFLTDMSQGDGQRQARLEVLGDIRPPWTLLGIPGLQYPEMLVEIEAEAIIGSANDRQTIYTENQAEKARGYARAVRVGDVVHVSGCTSIDADRNVRAVGDWAGQYDLAHEGIEAALKEAGATLDDVVRRRTFTIDRAEQNRPYGEGPPWFKDSRPVSLGCRISGLADPEMLVEVDAMAVIGASEDIEWLSLAE